MFGFIIFIHVVSCILLIIIILIQRGRGGGLVETFSDFESMFGPKTNTLLSRLTTVLAVLFLFTCLALAFLSAKQGRSLMEKATFSPVQKEASTTPLEHSSKPELPKKEVTEQGASTQASPTQQVATQQAPTQQAPTREVPQAAK